mmetsp:Transcript_16175/g.48650  ORF Transcript_16175/g.48650 Transcript_16175/m.48650 type:complete len:206 (+) Transcript_16175:286-903(+)
MKIVDDGTTGNYQHRENTVGVIEHTRFNLPKPIQIGMGKGSCLASTGVLVEDVTPHHADPSVGVVEVVKYLNPDGWKLEVSLKSPKVMLKSNIDVCAQNRNKYAPFCLSRSTYSTDGTAPTTHDCAHHRRSSRWDCCHPSSGGAERPTPIQGVPQSTVPEACIRSHGPKVRPSPGNCRYSCEFQEWVFQSCRTRRPNGDGRPQKS